jgi:hypothetical protein
VRGPWLQSLRPGGSCLLVVRDELDLPIDQAAFLNLMNEGIAKSQRVIGKYVKPTAIEPSAALGRAMIYLPLVASAAIPPRPNRNGITASSALVSEPYASSSIESVPVTPAIRALTFPLSRAIVIGPKSRSGL